MKEQQHWLQNWRAGGAQGANSCAMPSANAKGNGKRLSWWCLWRDRSEELCRLLQVSIWCTLEYLINALCVYYFFLEKSSPLRLLAKYWTVLQYYWSPVRLIFFLKNTLPFTLIPYCTFIRYSRLLTFLKVLTFKLASRKFRPTFSMPQLLDSSDWNLICKSLTDSYFSFILFLECITPSIYAIWYSEKI